jgi:crotonobetainyl-CoA:carnitine CoA-transferase CaiB-like acyl-CoA transferase
VACLAIIYCSITGFGQTGPRKDQAGYDFLLQGMAGLMSITGDPQGHPMKVGVAIVDIMTGLYATSSILAALLERDAQPEGKREGQHIDLSLFDVSVAFLANQVGIIYSFLFIFIFLQ